MHGISSIQKYKIIIDIYMKYFIIIISISYLFLSCSTESQRISDIQKLNSANSDKKFAFIQIPNEEEDSYNSKNSFGDIFVYYLIDSTLVRCTNDDFYDVGLSWSPDGKKLVFASSRDTYDSRTMDNGQAFHNILLYTLEIKSGEIKRIGNRTVPYLTGLTWNSNGIYYANWDNKIFKTDENTGNVSTLLELNEAAKITDLSFSYDGNYCVIESHQKEFSDQVLQLFDLNNQKLKKLPINGHATGWKNNNREFYFLRRDSVYLYDIYNNQLVFIPMISNNEKLMVGDCFVLDENQIIHTSIENRWSKLYKRSIRDLNTRKAIGIENIKTKELWYILKNDHYVESFSSYSIQKQYHYFPIK